MAGESIYPRGAVSLGTYRTDHERIAVYAGLEIRPAQMIGKGQTVTHEPIPADALEVSIQGSSWRAKADGTRDLRYGSYGGGQNVDDARKVATTRGRRIAELWDRWHLNGMRGGCAHQSEAWTCTRDLDHEAREAARRIGVPADSIPPARPCDTLNGWPVIRALYGEHAYPHSGSACHVCGRNRWDEPTDACPESGYRWGTSWLYEPVPADVLAELRALFGKPDGWTLPAGLAY